ncbi:protein FAM227B isoform X3 [Hemicordylus capensis]|uniref:protein FAM227B isoform X3 n=1 Tax=Hemicordylus capensis TaxID=884348 RepID=UPI002302E750|nr:protein FAM227B isoform X3 [Hemicordylus capensis]
MCGQGSEVGVTVAPPRTFDEFLLFQNLDDWPKVPYLPEVDVRPSVTKLTNNYSLNIITQYLYDNAPLPTEILSSLGERIDECKMKVYEHAKHIFALERSQEEIDDHQVSFLEQAADTSVSDSKGTLIREKKKKVKIAVDALQDSSCKTVENYKFSGFKLQKLTELPNHLEPAQLWDSVLKVQTFRGANVKVLKKLFLSEASLAILQDCFWWLFLQRFKPDQGEQDRLFDRISDSFVALLMSTPSYIKDYFFQMYPDCLSQAIYVTFCEAFPESSNSFEDEFKDELTDLIFQWIRGFKPQKFAWKKWNLWWLENTECSIKKESFQKMPLMTHQSLMPEMRSIIKSLKFQLDEEEQPRKARIRPKKESHYVGDGPDFERSLFNLGGQSPLVSYYLKMHGIANTLANSRAYRITHTEICKIPPVSPTYQDIIKQSEKHTRKWQHDLLDLEHKHDEELAEIEQEREKVNKKYKRLLKTITKQPTEARLKTEKFINQTKIARPRQTASLHQW